MSFEPKPFGIPLAILDRVPPAWVVLLLAAASWIVVWLVGLGVVWLFERFVS